MSARSLIYFNLIFSAPYQHYFCAFSAKCFVNGTDNSAYCECKIINIFHFIFNSGLFFKSLIKFLFLNFFQHHANTTTVSARSLIYFNLIVLILSAPCQHYYCAFGAKCFINKTDNSAYCECKIINLFDFIFFIFPAPCQHYFCAFGAKCLVNGTDNSAYCECKIINLF